MQKRLFFGFEVDAQWPQDLPKGRILDERHRHMTAAFLGNIDYDLFLKILPSIPKPSMRVGLAAQLDACLFLPEHHPRVVAWHVKWIDDGSPLLSYQKSLVKWLKSNQYHVDDREFLPHVTLCRSPFYPREWKKGFSPLPCGITNLHLYESTGHLQYIPLWTYSIQSPFEEIEHTADIAFNIYGENIKQLHTHSQIALATRFPPLLRYLSKDIDVKSIAEIVADLNSTIARADTEIGCPLKAVSYHEDVQMDQNQVVRWEMIIDV